MHYLCIFLPLLAALVQSRPQTKLSTDQEPWKPIELNTQPLRVQTRANKMAPETDLKDAIKKMASQLSNTANVTYTMDTRTPPKIKFQQRNMTTEKKPEKIENSHPGVAEPIDMDSFLETTPKRAVIYRTEHKSPTTDSGISTWILLSGQQQTTVKPKKPIKTTVQPTEKTTKTTTTRKPKSTTIRVTTTAAPTTEKLKTRPTTEKMIRTTSKTVPTEKILSTTEKIATTTEKQKLMTKIKASVLNNAKTTPAPLTTISVVTSTSTKMIEVNTTDPDTVVHNRQELIQLNPEAKDGGIELSTTTKKPKRPVNNTNKRKKNNNKNRRRKPPTASDKVSISNSTKIAQKDKPFGTQIYNYLSREVMPTVGVGLVGLMVTAGLASYFLYPFGGIRRAYENAADRKDYYYDDYAPGGVAEEELIGKVIAGMPEHTDYSYRTPLARKDYRQDNYYYRNSDYSYSPSSSYGRDVIEQQKETGYTVDDTVEKQQFVVGNVPKEFEPVTPVVVPEHGPRSLRIKRYIPNDAENEIIPIQQTTTETTTETYYTEPEPPNFFSFVRNLLELKVKYGLDLLLKTTDNFGNYLRGVQQRVNTILREDHSK